MAETPDLTALLRAIVAGDRPRVLAFLDTAPWLVTARLARREGFSAPAPAVTPRSRKGKPRCMRAVIEYLVDAGADPNAAASGGAAVASSRPEPVLGRGGGAPARRG